jgi:hypothetical protein
MGLSLQVLNMVQLVTTMVTFVSWVVLEGGGISGTVSLPEGGGGVGGGGIVQFYIEVQVGT